MYNLFKKLPRDLQWEVLTEFVGTHAVRKGKLIQKIAYSTNNDNVIHRHVKTGTFVPVVNGVRVRQCLHWLNRQGPEQRYIRFRSPKPVHFLEEASTGETIICYHKVISHIDMWEVNFSQVRTDDAITLPPFVKHVYPSYPFTEKKNKLRIR